MSEQTPPKPTDPNNDAPASPSDAFISQQRRKEADQFKTLLARLTGEGNNIFTAMHSSAVCDEQWTAYAYTQFQIVTMTATKALEEGLQQEARREQMRQTAERRRRASLN